MEQQKTPNEVAGGASDVERVVRPCNSCGSTRYEIQHLYAGYHENLLIVQCGDCKDRIIPVVVDYFMPQQEVYAKCETAWNGANTVPNARLEPPANTNEQNENSAAEGRSDSEALLSVTVDELRVICDTTVRLTEILQKGCAHLAVENIAPEIMRKLLLELVMHKQG